MTAFKLSISFLRQFLYGDAVAGPLFEWIGSANLVLIPTLGGVAVALLRATTGPFVGGLSDYIAQPDEKISLWAPFRKTIATVLTLGAGLSLGPEQGSVDIGAAAAQRLSQSLGFDGERRGLLLSCGAASGVAAGFNAPIAGVFFALERMAIGERIGRGGVDAAVVLLAASTSALVAQAGLGSTPAFEPPSYEMVNPLSELPMWLVLGALSGVASAGFRELLVAVNRFFNSSGLMAPVPEYGKPLVGGLFCGLVAWFFPQVLFFGYDTLSALLAGNDYFSIQLLFLLLFLKPVTTAICLGSGLIGGTVAPSLFLGAVVGALFQKTSAVVLGGLASINGELVFGIPLPEITIAATPAYALLGMASVLAGILRAPLTSSLLLFELTRDYKICAASMITSGIASAVANYEKGGVYDGEGRGEGFKGEDGAVGSSAGGVKESASFVDRASSEVDKMKAGAEEGDPDADADAGGDDSVLKLDSDAKVEVALLLQLGLPFVTPYDFVLGSVCVESDGVMAEAPIVSATTLLSVGVTKILARDCSAAIVWEEGRGGGGAGADGVRAKQLGLLTLERAVKALAANGELGVDGLVCGLACDVDCGVFLEGSSAAAAWVEMRKRGWEFGIVGTRAGPLVKPLGLVSVAGIERYAAREAVRGLMERGSGSTVGRSSEGTK